MDPVSDWCRATRTTGVLLARNQLSAPWGAWLDDRPEVLFHYVSSGEVWVRVRGCAPIRALQGDVVFLPHGTAHDVVSALDVTSIPLARFLETRRAARAKTGREATFVCCAYTFEWPDGHPLLRGMPPIVHMDAARLRGEPALNTMLTLLDAEVDGKQPGGEVLLQPLLEVLFVYLVRAWSVHAPGAGASWVNGGRDRAVAAALSAMHQHVTRAWTVAALAAHAHLSRAAFARRFVASVGMPPLTYLLHWRMAVATRLLRDESLGLSQVAERVGYRSEFAFSRAFKRVHGMPPATFRKAPHKTEMGSGVI